MEPAERTSKTFCPFWKPKLSAIFAVTFPRPTNMLWPPSWGVPKKASPELREMSTLEEIRKNRFTHVAFRIEVYFGLLWALTKACSTRRPPRLWPRKIKGRCSWSPRFTRRHSRSSVALSTNVLLSLPKTAVELYSYRNIRASGVWAGRSSCNHSLPSLVCGFLHVFHAWSALCLLRGFKPWTATILNR